MKLRYFKSNDEVIKTGTMFCSGRGHIWYMILHVHDERYDDNILTTYIGPEHRIWTHKLDFKVYQTFI